MGGVDGSDMNLLFLRALGPNRAAVNIQPLIEKYAPPVLGNP